MDKQMIMAWLQGQSQKSSITEADMQKKRLGIDNKLNEKFNTKNYTSMPSFLRYITEIYGPKTEQPPEHHPDYKGIDDEGQHVYSAEMGNDDKVETLFIKSNRLHNGTVYRGAAEVGFLVNNSWEKTEHNKHLDPAKVLDTVHGHFDHFFKTENPSAIFYGTRDPVRHRIFQMVAKRYGIPAFNSVTPYAEKQEPTKSFMDMIRDYENSTGNKLIYTEKEPPQ
jgi:hypothetical protein